MIVRFVDIGGINIVDHHFIKLSFS